MAKNQRTLIENSLSKAERDALVASADRLVFWTMKKYGMMSSENEDSVQEGRRALVYAASVFDPGRGIKFATYAAYWIRSFISRHLEAKSRAHRSPSPGESVTRREIPIASLDSQIEVDGASLHDIIPDERDALEMSMSVVRDSRVRGLVMKALASLTRRVRSPRRRDALRDVVFLRLLADPPETFETIGSRYGFSRETIRQTELMVLNAMYEDAYEMFSEDFPSATPVRATVRQRRPAKSRRDSL